MKRNILIFCVSSAILLFSGIDLFAKVDITPSLTLKEQYNDNMFLTRSDKEYDYITNISPSILVEYSPGSSLNLSLNYGLDFRYYSRNNNLNNTDIKDTQNIDFRAQAQPVNRVFVDVFDNYKRVPIDVRRKVASNNVFRNMTENNVFSISPYTVLPLSSTISTTLGYKYNNTWFRSDENSDSESHTGFLTLSKRFSSKLNGEIRYKYYKYIPDLKKRSDVIKDYDSHNGSLSVAYQITPDFAVNGEIGEARYNYKSGRDFDTDFWNIKTDYNLRISGGTSLGAGYGASLKDSPTSGAYKNRRLDMYIKTGNVFKLTVNPYYSKDKFLQTDREDRITGIAANIIQPLSSKIDVLLDGLWERQKFLDKDEKIRRYSAGISLDYKYSQKLTASLEYRNDSRNSNIDTEDFTDNTVSLQAKVVF